MQRKTRVTVSRKEAGFTLVELSIVLVIIGLIIGGVLVGRDLIDAASVRAQIAQIEKFNTSVNTFRSKYGYLPGDIPDPAATQFGLMARGNCGSVTPCQGEGDGDGLVAGWTGSAPVGIGEGLGYSETRVFWQDLSTTNLLNGAITTAAIDFPTADQAFPAARIGGRNSVYAYSYNGHNYYGMSVLTGWDDWAILSDAGLTVQQAYNIDRKTDDGLPQSGRITARDLTWNSFSGPEWVDGIKGSFTTRGASTGAPDYGPTTAATAWASTNCYDNNGVAGTEQYSTESHSGQTNAAQINCALSFQFQ